MSYNNVYVQLLGQKLAESPKAVHFQPADTDGNLQPAQWFPKSQIMSVRGTYDEIEGTFCIMMASEWILGQKSLLQLALEQKKAGMNTAVPTPGHPPVPKAKPAPNFSDMDDDIPF